MAKAWGHSRSGIEGLRLDLISALAGGSVSSPSSASSAKPQSRCAAASAAASPAQAGGRNVAVRPDRYQLRAHSRHVGLEAAKCLLLLPGVETFFTTRLSWHFINAVVLVGHPSSTCQTE